MKGKNKIFQCDDGGEFSSIVFINHLEQCSITRHISCPYTPQQNGVAERKHRHIVETALTIMFNASIPLSLWTEIFLASVYLINRTSLSTLSFKSPYEILFLRTPDYSRIRILGCRCFPCLRDYRKHKFDVKPFPCVFIGYSPLHKGYRCLNVFIFLDT